MKECQKDIVIENLSNMLNKFGGQNYRFEWTLDPEKKMAKLEFKALLTYRPETEEPVYKI